MTDLDQHLDGLGPDLSDDATRDAWRIDGEGEAGWALRQLARAVAEEQRIRQLADDRIALIEQWRDQALKAPLADGEYFVGRIRDWRRRLQAEDPTTPATIKLPEGRIERRKNPDAVEVTDDALFIAWCDLNEEPELVRETRAPAVNKLKERISSGRYSVKTNEAGVEVVVDTATGEAVPGVSYRHGEHRVDVRPDLDMAGGAQ